LAGTDARLSARHLWWWTMTEPILSIRNLRVDYITDTGPVRAIDGVSLDVGKREVLGIAGESGSGKTTLAQALLRILPPPAVITGGEALFEGRNLFSLEEPELRSVRWNRISMVFQSAMDALNPVITVGEQINDTLAAHDAVPPGGARARAQELLEMVGLDSDSVDAYTHQLSGGMRQRVGIALALALKPSLVILDEPTTALDVIVEKEILEEIRDLQAKLGFSVLFITHDLARMLQFSDRVAVFYAARLAEIAPAEGLRRTPRHPYTQKLLRAVPSLRRAREKQESIPGAPPSLLEPPSGCRFHPRCDMAVDVCRERAPELRELARGHWAACHRAE
jgi:peptide/nickel transport system ATP-binding protein